MSHFKFIASLPWI